MPKFVLLFTDAVMWALVAAVIAYVLHLRRRPALAAVWRRVFADAPALASSVVLAACLLVTLLDSVHFRLPLPPSPEAPAGSVAYDTRTRSLLDALLDRLVASRETTYSLPLAYVSYTRETAQVDGATRTAAPICRTRRRNAPPTSPGAWAWAPPPGWRSRPPCARAWWRGCPDAAPSRGG